MLRLFLPLFTFPLVLAAPALASETVPLAPFDQFELRGGGSVVVMPGPAERVTILEGSAAVTRFQVLDGGRLRIDACTSSCPHNYRLRIEIQSPRLLPMGVMGGGSINVANGFLPQPIVIAAVNGGGRVDAQSVDAASVTAAVNGGGEVLVRARDSLTAAVNGGGLIRYVGNPRLTSAVRGGGAVVRQAK